jgi:transposase
MAHFFAATNTYTVAIDPKHLPEDPKILQQMVLDLMSQLDREFSERNKIESLLRELLDAKRNRKSERLSADQLALFAAAWQARQAATEASQTTDHRDDDDDPAKPGAGEKDRKKRSGGRQALPRHLKRERIVHDLPNEEKHCSACHQDLRLIGEETSERYEYIPASVLVVEDACLKYACACTVRTAGKPAQPIEKSTAGASLLAQVIVAKSVDHLPLHRQEKIFERHGVEISRKTMCGWLAQCADLLNPLYCSLKEVLFQSKVIGTDDTSVKVLDVKLPFARTGHIWPYYGDKDHPVIVYDYTATRERAGPEKFLKGYRGYLQADAYGGYDAFFKVDGRAGSADSGHRVTRTESFANRWPGGTTPGSERDPSRVGGCPEGWSVRFLRRDAGDDQQWPGALDGSDCSRHASWGEGDRLPGHLARHHGAAESRD